MEFNHLTKQLNQLLAQDYVAFSITENPVVKILSQASFAQIAYVMQQYSIFPKELVGFTELARRKALGAGWNGVAQELQENIDEEMGSTTQGISHYTLLADGLEEGLGYCCEEYNAVSCYIQTAKNCAIAIRPPSRLCAWGNLCDRGNLNS